jgi:hypothetical protein
MLARAKADLTLQAAQRQLDISNKCIDLVTERLEISRRRELDDIESTEASYDEKTGLSDDNVAHINVVTDTNVTKNILPGVGGQPSISTPDETNETPARVRNEVAGSRSVHKKPELEIRQLITRNNQIINQSTHDSKVSNRQQKHGPNIVLKGILGDEGNSTNESGGLTSILTHNKTTPVRVSMGHWGI